MASMKAPSAEAPLLDEECYQLKEVVSKAEYQRYLSLGVRHINNISFDSEPYKCPVCNVPTSRVSAKVMYDDRYIYEAIHRCEKCDIPLVKTSFDDPNFCCDSCGASPLELALGRVMWD